jgi:hypothetical protein
MAASFQQSCIVGADKVLVFVQASPRSRALVARVFREENIPLE